MKILFLPENYFPDVSGVPVVVKYLAEGLQQKGHDVTVACKSFKQSPKDEYINNVHVIRFNIWKDWKHSYKGDLNDFRDFVINFNADVNILECSECVTTDIVLPVLKLLKGKVIFHSHGFSGLELKLFMIKGNLYHTIGNIINWFSARIYFNWTLKVAMKYIDASMCLSEVDSSNVYLSKYCKRSYILDNAADDRFFDSGAIKPNVLSKYVKLKNLRYVMCCANYTFVKNQKDMITQYFMSDSSKNISLVCIGSQPTPYFKECVDLVAQLKAEYGERDVHLLYGVDRMDIPSIMHDSSLYLVSSRYEQYSISIIEAMSQGVPFISMNTGNARVLPGGYTINTIEEMHTMIDKLIADKKMHNRYSVAGKKFAYENCRIPAVVGKLEDIINTIV